MSGKLDLRIADSIGRNHIGSENVFFAHQAIQRDALLLAIYNHRLLTAHTQQAVVFDSHYTDRDLSIERTGS